MYSIFVVEGERIIKKLKNSKSPSKDDIIAGMFKYGGKLLKK